tara:strand:- start:2786 stop:3787 length:1002 start_codon:yes stop_codon:yes gene_type:complete
MKKKILIIGTGSIAKRHVTNILKLKQSVTLNLFSKSEKRAKNFISNFKGKKISLLNSSELKKKKFTHIIIASKTTLHNKYIFDFYKVCENIFCEKPLPIDRFTKSLIRICKNKINGEKIKIGFQFRFNPAIQFMKKELKKKENKKVFLIKFSCGQNLKDWRNNKNYRDLFSAGNSFYGSVIWELCHDIDTLQYIFRKPNKVFSKLTNSNLLKVDTDDISISTLKFKNCDTNCTISLEMLSPILYRNLIVISLNNYYEVDLIKNVIIKKNKNKISKYFFKTNRNFMFETLIKNFISNKNKSKKFDHATLIDGIFVSKVVNKMYISNKKNKFISI